MYGSGWMDDVCEKPKKTQPDLWRMVRTFSPLAGKFVDRLTELDAILPNGKELRMIRDQLEKLQSGEPITITSVICPDYLVSNEGGTLRYTFQGLGDGIGLVTRRAMDVHVRLKQFFAREGVSGVRSELIMASQEATEENCQRMKTDQAEFIARLKRSQLALADEARKLGVEVSTPLLTEMDSDSWNRAKSDAEVFIRDITNGQINSVRISRLGLIQQWAGRLLSSDEITKMIIAQGTEYIAVGKFLAHPGRLILGLDSPVMEVFLRRGTRDVTPVVYFRRPSY
ncbi:MAG: hypothetical protein Q8Q03_01670 [bacterium]|nr:hypothetical protein [bacterium]